MQWEALGLVEMELSLCRVMVSPRVDARQVEAKGMFPGAEVVRGNNWKFGDQDGERESQCTFGDLACTLCVFLYRRCGFSWQSDCC